jgi:DNA primase
MNIRFSDDILALIKDRLPVSEIIGRRTTLKQKGKDYLGLCPFHQEKTPSFTVNDQKGFYHCFGCGAHGDVFKFLTDYEKLSFQEAVEQCAHHAGVTLPKATPQQQKTQAERDLLFKLLSDTDNLFQHVLQSSAGKEYHDYLTARGITKESIQKFHLGVSPKGRITQFINTNNIPLDLAEKVGLVSKYDNAVKEKFIDRLMFPIFDEKKRVVGFGGRTLNENIQPKYLNSSDNDLFHKGNLLYGLHLMDHKNSSAILVEGYLDVIAMIQSGFKNVFAPMGTAVTQEQAKKVLKYFNKIYLCFDGDSAGFKAMSRAAEVFLPLLQPGIELLFMRLPEGQDPHSLITSGQTSVLNQKIKTPLNLVEFLKIYEALQHPGLHPSALALQRKNVLDLIATVQDPFLKSLYKDQVYALFQTAKASKKAPISVDLPKTTSVHIIYEAVLVKSFLLCPNLYSDLMDQLDTYPLSSKTQEILSVIETYIFSGDKLEFLSIVPYIKEHLPTLNIDSMLSDTLHVHAPFLNDPIDEKNVRTGIERILEHFNDNASLEAHIKEAQERFKKSQDQADWDRLKILMAQKQHRNDDE